MTTADGEQRRVRAVASGRLAVAADPEAGEREQERGEAERADLRDVEHEPGPEAGERSEDRAGRECDGDEEDEDEVGRAAEDSDRGDDRHLHDDGEEEEHRRFRDGEGHGIFGRGLSLIRTTTASTELKSTSGITWTTWNVSMSVWPTFVTTPIGIPLG